MQQEEAEAQEGRDLLEAIPLAKALGLEPSSPTACLLPLPLSYTALVQQGRVVLKTQEVKDLESENVLVLMVEGQGWGLVWGKPGKLEQNCWWEMLSVLRILHCWMLPILLDGKICLY